MKKYLISVILLVSLVAMMACGPGPHGGGGKPSDEDEALEGLNKTLKVKITPNDVFSDESTKDVTVTVKGKDGAAVEGVKIYYTTDGSVPTTESAETTGTISVSQPAESGIVEVKVLAVKGNDGGFGTGRVGFEKYGLDFVAKNWDGSIVTMTDFTKYEYLHIEFSCEWCGPCKLQGSKMEGIIEELQKDGYSIESITTIAQGGDGQSPAFSLVQDWHTRYGLKYVVGDKDGASYTAFSSAYGDAGGWPYNVLLRYNKKDKKFEKVAAGSGGITTKAAMLAFMSGNF